MTGVGSGLDYTGVEGLDWTTGVCTCKYVQDEPRACKNVFVVHV